MSLFVCSGRSDGNACLENHIVSLAEQLWLRPAVYADQPVSNVGTFLLDTMSFMPIVLASLGKMPRTIGPPKQLAS